MVYLLLFLVSASAQCTIKSNNFFFDFSPLSGKQITYNGDPRRPVQLTFCEPALCGSLQSSVCQSQPTPSPPMSMGVWTKATNWQGSAQQLTVQFQGGTPDWCDPSMPRYTNATFQCVDGLQTPQFTLFTQIDTCGYSATIKVPSSLCSLALPCCTPSVYTATRVESDRTTAVVQADDTQGWFDQNYKGSGKSMLCSLSYGRCFSFDSTSCVGSDFQPAPSQCFGGVAGKDWQPVASGNLFLNNKDIVQSSWVSATTSGSVTTLTISSNQSECLAVYGTNTPTLFGLGIVPNASLWEIPKSCLKQYYY